MSPWNKKPANPVRDYSRRTYGNPLFKPAGGTVRRGGNNRPVRRGASGDSAGLGMKALLAAVVLLLGGGAWYAFWSPALAVTDVIVEGASPATEETIRAALDEYAEGSFLIFPRRTILFFEKTDAREAIEDSVFLEGVEIRKKLPHTVEVTVREKQIKAVFLRDGRLYGLDESGFTVRLLSSKEIDQMGELPPELNAIAVGDLGTESVPVPDALKVQDPNAPLLDEKEQRKLSKNAWPLLIDNRTNDLRKDVRVPSTQAFSAATVSIVLQANARLPDVTEEAVRWFTPDETADSIDALMLGDWHVHLSTVTPFDVQAERLSLVLKEKIGNRKAELEYVDLRYNERIFYRMRGAGGDTPQTMRSGGTVPAATSAAESGTAAAGTTAQ